MGGYLFESERLAFRRLTPDDAGDLAALYADPEVMRFFEGTRTYEQAREEIEEARDWYDYLGFYFWATLLKSDGRFIGRCGLLPQVIDDRNECEVAYMIARPFWNQGFGTEAARAIREYGFSIYDYPRLISIVAPENRAARRVAEKNGMTFVKYLEFEGKICCLYAVERPS